MRWNEQTIERLDDLTAPLPRLAQIALMSCVLVGLTFAQTNTTFGQTGRLPKAQYYNNAIFSEYYLADYQEAAKYFSKGATTAYKRGTRRYLDSICFWTMLGECHYHTGDYAQATEMYETALGLYLTFQAENWQSRLQVPLYQRDSSAFQQARINRGKPRRNGTYSKIPDTFTVQLGRLDASRVLDEGGVVDNAEILKIDVVEIMRCTALCLHRRSTIKGVIAQHDPFTNQLVTGLSIGGAGSDSVMGSFNGVLLGIAQASMQDYGAATRTLKASLEINGMDHPLTPVALVELTRIGMAEGNFGVAGELALEASYSAAVYNQYDLVEEALGLGTTIHLMSAKTPYPPLENAILWARGSKAKLMQASLIVKLAECLAEGGQADLAANVLKETNKVISNRNSLANAVLSARAKYVGALIRFLKGDFRGGGTALNGALQHFQKGSFWLYRLGLADELVVSGRINDRQADLLYSGLLRDPNEMDWRSDPFESLAFLASPHVGAMERWFDIVVERKNNRRALEIADLVRRHRFFSGLPLGGRLTAFRWVLHAPDEALSETVITQRQEFLKRNPQYQQLMAQANQIRTSLDLLPLKPEPRSKEEREQTQLMDDLMKLSNVQEAILASYALRREPSEMVFPPQLPIEEFQKESIEKDQLALVCMATARGYHLFLLNNEAIKYVGLLDGNQVLLQVAGLLKQMGLMDNSLEAKDLQGAQWQESAIALKNELFAGAADSDWKNFRELVIVPDGVLWYLPFEALPVEDADVQKYLSDVVNIRYSPTLFLAFQAQRPARPIERSAFVVARMSARGEAELAKNEFTELLKKMPDSVLFETAPRVPSNYLASMFDQLVVWSEIKSTKGKPLTLSPMQVDGRKPGNSLEAWMALPWAGPEHVIMPGFNSDGGASLRGKLNGMDLFFTSLGLMSSGTRTVLISRWATGGKTSLDLSGQYAAEMSTKGIEQAILDSRQTTRTLNVDFENEPGIRFKKSDPAMKAEHPYFWAAHMLFSVPDSSPPPAKAVAAPQTGGALPAGALPAGAKPDTQIPGDKGPDQPDPDKKDPLDKGKTNDKAQPES